MGAVPVSLLRRQTIVGLIAALAFVLTLRATGQTQAGSTAGQTAGQTAGAPALQGATPPAQGAPAAPGAPGARGTGQGRGLRGAGDPTVSDFTPKTPYLPRTPAEEAKGFRLPTGYRLELVASDPDIINPVAIEFDGNGRMYVAEMIGYMMDAEATREHDPISRISRWESTKGDGHFDKHTVFADKLVAPRMILPLTDGVVLTSETDSDDIIKLTDTNGDGIADKREVVFTGIGQGGDANIEHQKAGLLWNLDNWIYTTYNSFRIRWTPTGFLREPTGSNGGQWGLGSDDDGKPWFVDAGGERGPMNFQYPIHYGGFTACAGAARGAFGAPAGPPATPNPNCPAGFEGGFEPDFATVWPSPGIGDMQGGLFRTRMPAANLNHFTASTGPAIFRGHRLPADLKGDLLFAEPVGRLIRRAKVDNIEGLTLLRNAYPQSEFITSEDQLFRPVNISNAPDGTVYIADMYHGIIQERQWSGPGEYLRAKIEQYQLDKVVNFGRIWRLRYDGRAAVPTTATNRGQTAIPAIELDSTPPHMYSETSAQLVSHLTHANGWYRDMAQRLLILKQDKSVLPALQQLARTSDNVLARVHATWTLEGLGALDATLVRALLKDQNLRLRMAAIRASETLYKAGDKSLADDYRAMTKDTDPNVVIQAMLTLNLFKVADASTVITAAQDTNSAKGVKVIAANLLRPPAAAAGGGRGGGNRTPEEQKLLDAGSDVFNNVCASCHAGDGRGQPLANAAVPGTMMAPPLAGSPRVTGHRDYVIKVLLYGLTGPLGDKTYSEVMIPMNANSDEWIAGIASFVRNSFDNAAGMVTAADVARVRAETPKRTRQWTLPELEPTLPRPLEPSQLTLTASHNTAQASNAVTLRGWSTAAPQAAGMWFQVELAQPAMVSEISFTSTGGGRGGGFGGRGAAGAGRAGAAGTEPTPAAGAPGATTAPPQTAAPAATGAPAQAAPSPGFPRAYSVTVSMDGKTWGKPVATGKGTGARTDITFTPTRAKFVRITQTDTVADAPNWSITFLRVFETAGK